jgi:hypothetical protein
MQSSLRTDGTGDRYRARDIRLVRKVPVKILPFAKDARRLLRFVLWALNNPHRRFILEVGALAGGDYPVSDFLEQHLRNPVSCGAF